MCHSQQSFSIELYNLQINQVQKFLTNSKETDRSLHSHLRFIEMLGNYIGLLEPHQFQYLDLVETALGASQPPVLTPG